MNDVLALFMGVSYVLVAWAVTYLIYQLTRGFKSGADRNERVNLFEMALIDKIAKDSDINLDVEKKKYVMLDKDKKTYEKILEKKVIELIEHEHKVSKKK